MSYNHSAMPQTDGFVSTDTSERSINVKSGIKIPNQEPAHWFNGSFCLSQCSGLHAWEFRRSQTSLSSGSAEGNSLWIFQQDIYTRRERLLLFLKYLQISVIFYRGKINLVSVS